mgnify:CR=1 FL=1
MVAVYRKFVSGKRAGQARTHEGGVAFAVDHWMRLRRFLVLGSSEGTFYVGERELTAENARVVTECLDEDAARSVVVATSATEVSLADPKDALSLDVAGFDTAAPQVIADFVIGVLSAEC